MQTNIERHEQDRINLLRGYGILDTPPEEAFDEIARLASQVCNAPIALVAFIDAERQWNKSIIGWSTRENSRQDSLCAHAINGEEVLVIEDTCRDERMKENRFVTQAPHVRFYAGAPLKIPGQSGLGHGSSKEKAIGALCVMDTTPRSLTREQADGLKILARQVVAHLQLRRSIADLHARNAETEVALKHSESFYQALVETLPQNIFRKNLKGEFTFANSRFCATVHRSLEEILGRTDFDLFPEELAEKYQADDHRVIETNKPFTTIEQHRTASGSTLYVKVIKTPLYDLAGRMAGIQGIFWDETDRFKAEAALEYERALFHAMLDNLPDSIYFKDRDSRFIAISRFLAGRLGLSDAEEAIGKRDSDFFAPEHARVALEDERRILLTGQPLVAKTEKETSRSGREAWVLSTKVPLKNSHGEIIGTFGISKDITDLKAAEAELALARDAALESVRLKSEFLANMSHEIRTPLNAVIGMTGLLLDTPLSEEQRDFTETIRNSADSLLTIINDILDFSKIEAGRMAIEVIDFDLTEVIESTAELVAEPAQAKEVELASSMHEQTPRQLRGDPGRLRQVLTNLLGNAVKFTEKGEVVLDVKTERETDREVVLRFSVRDTGVGIPLEAHHRIFQAFTQADGSTTRRYGGTGLGLAICKQLVELMGGQMGFESAPGRGSTFWFTVPFEKQQDQKFIPPMASTLEGLRVMVVDDNSTNREIVHRQVISWKMRNGSAESGPKALQLLKTASMEGDPYRLVLLDMQMPGMDGLTLANAINADPSLGQPRLIMLTSVGQLAEEKRWRQCGISAYLVKPVKEARLFDAIVTVMRGHPGAAQVERRSALVDSTTEQPTFKHFVRILIAEDNVVNQKVALRQLQKLGFSADAVANGFEVLQALENVPYEIILMDCQMPELDGYEATRRIRLEESRARLKGGTSDQYIVAMTANALAGDREECLAAGMNDYISKPVRIDELAMALQRALTYLDQRKLNPNPSSNAGPVLDPTVIQSLRELRNPGEADPLRELVDLFVTDTPERIARIEAAMQTNNMKEVESTAHSLKGSASNLGAIRLANVCADLLRQARAGRFADPNAVKGIHSEFEKAAEALAREL